MGTRKRENATKQKRARINLLLYSFSAVCVLIAGIAMFVSRAQASVHPKPRAEAEQLATENPDLFATYPEVRDTYRMAAHVKSILDGLFCYCHCEGAGHYSLLDCFRDEHGAGCDICLESAQIAYRMAQEGKTLDEIRTVLDQTFTKG